jgi:uncharacterized protein (TIGR00297 family)
MSFIKVASTTNCQNSHYHYNKKNIQSMTPYLDHPYALYLCASFIIFLTIILVKIITEKKRVHQETGRKILHFVAIIVCAFVVFHTQSRMELAWIFLVFSVLLLYVAHQNVLLPSTRKSYGIGLFPLAFSLMLFSDLPIESILFGMITLGISDALAGIVGAHFAPKKVVFLYEPKSWLGFSVFYISTLIIGYGFIGFTPLLLILALVPAWSELFSIRGSDNLSVPIMSSSWLFILQQSQTPTIHWLSFLGMVLILSIVFYKKWLSETGIAAALLCGTLIIFSVGPIYLLPIALFFIVGSLSSRLHPQSKDAQGRNAFQVFANGLLAVITIIIYFVTKNEIFLMASLASVAISLSDTLSSDIGTYFKNKTYDITTFQPIKPGLSGGISFSGTLAGVVGSIIFSWFIGVIFNLQIKDMFIISISGISGMFLDSIIGSLWQAKFIYKNEILEEKTDVSPLIKGKAWLNNDGVNFLSNLIILVVLVGTLHLIS